MAYPTSGTPVQTQFATSVTSMAVNMPATVDSGDLLLAFAEVRNAGTWTVPTDWVEFKAQLGGSSVGELTAFYKIADGDEDGGTATWTASTGTSAIWQVIRITGWHGTTPPEAASAQGDYTTNPNPPSLSPSWGAEDTLWLEVAGNSATSTLTTGASTNYSGYQANTASSGGAQVNIASAYRQLNASSEDPGVFANSTNIRYWAAMTVAIRPAAVAGGGDFVIADEASSSSIDNITLAQAGGTLSIEDESSASSIDNITLQFQGNFEIADEVIASSIDTVSLEFGGGTLEIADVSSISNIENITLGQSGELLPADESSVSLIDNITLEVGGGSFVVENEAIPSSIDNITLEQNGGTLSIADEYSSSTIDNVSLIGNFIIGDVVCETTTEEITLEFEGATFVIEDIASTSEIDNIPLVGDFIIQDSHAPPTIENITLEIANGDFVIGDLDSSSAITNIRIVKNIPDELKTIFIVNRGKVAKWISGNNYIEL